jgi:hypothetical protein
MAILGVYLLLGSVLVSFGYTVGVGSTLIMISYGEKFLRGFALAESWAERRSVAGASAMATGDVSPGAGAPPAHTPG